MKKFTCKYPMSNSTQWQTAKLHYLQSAFLIYPRSWGILLKKFISLSKHKGLILLCLNRLNRSVAVVVDQESDFEFTSSKWQEKQATKCDLLLTLSLLYWLKENSLKYN